MTPFLLLLGAAVLAVCLFDWRRGLLLCLCVGFAQDPIRKLLPGRPVALVVAVALCFVVCMVGLFARGDRLGLQRLFRWFPRVRPAAAAFLLVVLLQAFATVLRTGNSVLAGIGLLSYLSPPLALLLGERYVSDLARFQRWVRWYLAGSLCAGGTVLLQALGWNPQVFASIGFEWVYGASGAVQMLNGILRSSEIAAWHAAAGCCLLSAWAIGARTSKVRWIGGVAAAALLAAVFLTGRRKMLAEIALFAVIYGVLLFHHRRGASRAVQFGAVAVLVALVGVQLRGGDESGPELGAYLTRGATVFADAGERLGGMTIGMFASIISRNGLLGSGAGTGAQGSQYFGGGTAIVGGAAEGGMGKVLAELGVPGLVALAWLGIALGRVVFRIVRFARSCPAHQALRLYGLAAFLPANAAVFLTAHQVFGDPFVLIVLGLVTGSILAFPKIVLRERLSLGAQAPVPTAPAGRRVA